MEGKKQAIHQIMAAFIVIIKMLARFYCFPYLTFYTYYPIFYFIL